jgi:hypothetical protein
MRCPAAAAQISKPTSSAASRSADSGVSAYTAGLEIWAANTKSFVHRNTVILPSQQLAVGVNANSTPTVTNVSRSAFVFKIVSLTFHCFGLW